MFSAATAHPLDLRLVGVRHESRDILTFEFASLARDVLPGGEAGAHIGVHLPNGVMRQYSLLRCDSAMRSYAIGVKLDANSRGGSRFLHQQSRVGDIYKVDPPRNNFPLCESAPHSVLIAGGIGITPILAMIGRLESLGRSWQLYYASRSREHAAFLDVLQNYPDVQLHFDEETGGAPLDVAACVAAAPANAHLYCCGPAPMLKAFESCTADWPHDQVHVEYFTSKSEAARAGGFVVELAKSGLELPVAPGRTILQVLLDAGVQVPSSCEQGVCGACETRVLAGAPDHRDAILSEAERAANETMMVCCSGAKSERLVLDL